jgi:hypothetical protein
MKRLFIIYPWLLFLLFAATSGVEDSYLNLPEPDDVIVVDGWIENGQFAKVLLTKNSPYFSKIDSMCLDDILFSGEKFGFSLSRGPETFLTSSGNRYFEVGDTVSIKFCTIDKAHFDFWNSFQDETFNSANPFASATQQIQSNIQGNGLGIWGGYGATYYTLIIQ